MNKRSIIIKNIAAIIACIAIAGSLAGCAKKSDTSLPDNSGQNSSISSDTGSVDIGGDIPQDGASNSDPLEATDDETYEALGSAPKAAMRDDNVFISGEGYQYRFATGLLADAESDGRSVSLREIESSVDKIIIGDKSYAYGDLIKDQSKGLEIVKLFSKDFGLNICDDEGNLIERKGDMSESDDLRSLYSDRVDFEDYTACAYYFDVRMNNLDDDTYGKYIDAYEAKYNLDRGETLDGKLGVVLYYDTEGHDYFYSIVICAPTYYSSEENFLKNMNNNIRKDATNCRMIMKDGLSIGFAGEVVLMCGGAE